MTAIPRPITNFANEPSSPWMDGTTKPVVSGAYQRAVGPSVTMIWWDQGVWYSDARHDMVCDDQQPVWRGMPGSAEDVQRPATGFKSMGAVATRLRMDGHYAEEASAWRMVAEARTLINAARALYLVTAGEVSPDVDANERAAVAEALVKIGEMEA